MGKVMLRLGPYEKRINNYLKIEAEKLKRLGIQPVSRPMALNYLLEKYRIGEIFKKMESKRMKRNKREIVIKIK